MNHQHVVSILVPIYNAETYLSQCIESILGQTYANLQIILIDDGSIDNSYAICQEYAGQDARIELYTQENKGVAVTRNNLIEKAKGDYILFVDSDDWIELNMVEFLIDQMLATNADIVTCAMVKNATPVNLHKFYTEIWEQKRLIKEFLAHVRLSGSLCNKIIRRELFNGIIFESLCSYGEDAYLFWQVIQKAKSLLLTDRELYHYRMNSTSLSHSAWTPEKKGSNHIVWEQITNDTALLWPEYIDIAKVRAALEDMWALYYAAQAGYEYNEHIYIRQRSVRENIWRILKSDIPSTNMKLYSMVASLSYWLLKYIHR